MSKLLFFLVDNLMSQLLFPPTERSPEMHPKLILQLRTCSRAMHKGKSCQVGSRRYLQFKRMGKMCHSLLLPLIHVSEN